MGGKNKSRGQGRFGPLTSGDNNWGSARKKRNKKGRKSCGGEYGIRREERSLQISEKKSKVWKIINKQRKKRKRRCAEIDMREWKKYFMRIMGEVEHKIITESRRERRGIIVEDDIDKKKIRRAMRKLKDVKAEGIDEIPNKVWKYGRERIEEWVWNFSNRVWGGRGMARKLERKIIAPILKKKEGKRVKIT